MVKYLGGRPSIQSILSVMTTVHLFLTVGLVTGHKSGLVSDQVCLLSEPRTSR